MGDANDDNALKNGLGCGTRVSAEDPPLTAPEVHLELHLAPPPPIASVNLMVLMREHDGSCQVPKTQWKPTRPDSFSSVILPNLDDGNGHGWI